MFFFLLARESLGSFDHRNLRTFESRVVTQKLTRLCNNPKYRVSRLVKTFFAIIIFSPLFITRHYYHHSHIIILPFSLFAISYTANLLKDHPPIIYVLIISYREWEMGDKKFLRRIRVTQQRPRKGPHFSSEGVLPRKICISLLIPSLFSYAFFSGFLIFILFSLHNFLLCILLRKIT